MLKLRVDSLLSHSFGLGESNAPNPIVLPNDLLPRPSLLPASPGPQPPKEGWIDSVTYTEVPFSPIIPPPTLLEKEGGTGQLLPQLQPEPHPQLLLLLGVHLEPSD